MSEQVRTVLLALPSSACKRLEPLSRGVKWGGRLIVDPPFVLPPLFLLPSPSQTLHPKRTRILPRQLCTISLTPSCSSLRTMGLFVRLPHPQAPVPPLIPSLPPSRENSNRRQSSSPRPSSVRPSTSLLTHPPLTLAWHPPRFQAAELEEAREAGSPLRPRRSLRATLVSLGSSVVPFASPARRKLGRGGDEGASQ